MQNIISQIKPSLDAGLAFIQRYFPIGKLQMPDFSIMSLVVAFSVLVIFLIGLTFGRSRVLIALISIYIARVIEMNFIYFDRVVAAFKNTDVGLLRVGLFTIFFMIAFFL